MRTTLSDVASGTTRRKSLRGFYEPRLPRPSKPTDCDVKNQTSRLCECKAWEFLWRTGEFEGSPKTAEGDI